MKRLFGICLAAWAICLGGCAGTTSLKTWQREFEHYVDREGGGDFAAVRNLSDSRTYKQFGVLGQREGAVAPKRTDLNGVIVGHRRVGDNDWLLFVVATIRQDGGMVDVQFDHPSVTDLRAAAVSRQNGKYVWVVSEPSPAQLAAYLAAQNADWQRSDAGRAAATAAFTHFPTERDRLGASIDGTTATLCEQRSGAQWVLELSTAAPPLAAIK